MAKFCSECGSPIEEGMAFCGECGAKVEGSAEPTPAPQPIPVPQPQVVNVVEDKDDNVVGTGAFFGTMLLFAIPCVGFILTIILSCAPKNKSYKNFAKANLIFYIIGIAIALLIFIISAVIGYELNSGYYYY